MKKQFETYKVTVTDTLLEKRITVGLIAMRSRQVVCNVHCAKRFGCRDTILA